MRGSFSRSGLARTQFECVRRPVPVSTSSSPARVPAVQTIDNGAAGFSATPGWSGFAGQGLQSDVHFASAGAGGQAATWSFAVSPGQYRVAATWSTHANRATDAPFTILDGLAPLMTVLVDQEQAPNDFSDGGASWEYLGGVLNIAGGALTVRLSDAANQYVIADAVRLERLGDLPATPEIQVLQGAVEVVDGGSNSFGATLSGVPIEKTFRVRNLGAGSLTVQPVSVPSGFSVVTNIPVDTVLAGGAEVSFTVRLLAAATGSFSGELSFANTDGDENPYNFNISGSVGQVAIIDNGQSGFQSMGGWESFPGQGLQNSVHFTSAGGGGRVASWTFDLTPGQYRVAATWSPHANRATNAPYTVSEGGNTILTLPVDQTQTPNDITDAGAGWKYLGGVLNLTGTKLTVSLSDDANRYVIADAVRLERIGDLPAGPEIQLFDGAAEVLDGTGPVSLGATFVGAPVQKTLRVKNIGAGSLTLQPVSVPAGFTVVSNIPPNTQFASGAETTFTVQLNAASLGGFSGELSFANTDGDENPFNFTITGAVSTVRIIDNGDTGFSTVGFWPAFAGDGYQNDVHYIGAGSGALEALWTFAVSPGQYRVAATWSIYSNRATDAPFTVYNGSTPLSAAAVDQQAAPNDLADAGVGWEYLGGVLNITTSTLTVKLTDLANSFVIADAIRLERLGDLPGGGGRAEKGTDEGETPPPPADPDVAVRPTTDAGSAVEDAPVVLIEAPAAQDSPAVGEEETVGERPSMAESQNPVEATVVAVDDAGLVGENELIGLTKTSAETALQDDTIALLADQDASDLDNINQPEPEQIVGASLTASADSSSDEEVTEVAADALLSDLQSAGDLVGTLAGRKRRSLLLRSDAERYVDYVFALDNWQVG